MPEQSADNLVIVPSDGDGFMELARTKTGRLFRKHLLNMGNLLHPTTGKPLTIDEKFATTLKKNFNDGVCDIVQVPLANARNEHTEDPERNIGEVVDIEVKDKKIYAILDIREDKHADKLGKTYLGASAMMHLDYTDTKTGKKVGPTLLHSCVTNRPYVTGLDSYEEIVAATADSSERAVLLLSEDTVVVDNPEKATESAPEANPEKVKETEKMGDNAQTETPAKPSLEELLTILKEQHNIDVSALQAKATEGTQAAELSATLVDALTKAGVVKLSNTDEQAVSTDTVVKAVSELADNNVALTTRVNKLERQDAEHAVDSLVSEGRVLPAQKGAYVELKLTNPSMFEALIPAQPIVKLSEEKGVTPPDDAAQRKNIDQDIARYVALANGK